MEEKNMKKSFSGLGWRFLIGTLIIYAVQVAVVSVVGQVKPEWLENKYDHQPDPCCPAVVSDRYAGIDRTGEADPRGSTCEEKYETRTVHCGTDHVLCIDVLR